MAAPAVGNVYQVRVACYDVPLTQVAINTFYFSVTNTAGVGTMTETTMCGALDALWASRYKPILANNSEYYGLTIQNWLVPKPRPAVIPSTANTGAGTAGANTLPNQVTDLVSFRTQYSGRGYRGRIYLPFPPTTASDANGAMTAAWAATVNTDVARWFALTETVTQGANSIQGVYQVRHTIPPTPPATSPSYAFNTITQAIVPVRFATQRRRGQFGRINSLPF